MAISYLCLMTQLNMIEELCAHRMEERKRATYFAKHREMDHEQNKEKREEERVVEALDGVNAYLSNESVDDLVAP
jgi:hypothetical protein